MSQAAYVLSPLWDDQYWVPLWFFLILGLLTIIVTLGVCWNDDHGQSPASVVPQRSAGKNSIGLSLHENGAKAIIPQSTIRAKRTYATERPKATNKIVQHLLGMIHPDDLTSIKLSSLNCGSRLDRIEQSEAISEITWFEIFSTLASQKSETIADTLEQDPVLSLEGSVGDVDIPILQTLELTQQGSFEEADFNTIEKKSLSWNLDRRTSISSVSSSSLPEKVRQKDVVTIMTAANESTHPQSRSNDESNIRVHVKKSGLAKKKRGGRRSRTKKMLDSPTELEHSPYGRTYNSNTPLKPPPGLPLRAPPGLDLPSRKTLRADAPSFTPSSCIPAKFNGPELCSLVHVERSRSSEIPLYSSTIIIEREPLVSNALAEYADHSEDQNFFSSLG